MTPRTRASSRSGSSAESRDREKRQPYATESESYDGETVKSPSDAPDTGAEAEARAENIGKPYPDLQESQRRG
jgi:hypothetical protein